MADEQFVVESVGVVVVAVVTFLERQMRQIGVVRVECEHAHTLPAETVDDPTGERGLARSGPTAYAVDEHPHGPTPYRRPLGLRR